MKRLLLAFLLLLGAWPALAQSVTELAEELRAQRAMIDNLTETIVAQQRKIQDLERQVSRAEAEISRPRGNYATADDVKALREKVNEVIKQQGVDRENMRKAMEDSIKELGRTLLKDSKNSSSAPKNPGNGSGNGTAASSAKPPKALKLIGDPYEYPIQPNDNLFKIKDSFNALLKEKKLPGKVTVDGIRQANPGLNDKGLIVGKKILIPIEE